MPRLSATPARVFAIVLVALTILPAAALAQRQQLPKDIDFLNARSNALHATIAKLRAHSASRHGRHYRRRVALAERRVIRFNHSLVTASEALLADDAATDQGVQQLLACTRAALRCAC